MEVSCQKSNYQFLFNNCKYFLDTYTLSYLGIGCQIESIMNGDLKLKMGKSLVFRNRPLGLGYLKC